MRAFRLTLLLSLVAACAGQRAVDLAQRADRRLPGDRQRLRLMHEQALDALAAGKLETSQRLALKCLEADAGFAAAHRLLGDLYELESDGVLAVVEHLAFADLARGTEPVPVAWQDYRRAKIAGGDLAGPDSRDRRARLLHRVSLALAMLRAGKSAPAKRSLLEAAQALPEYALAHAAAGMVLWRLGDQAQALPFLRRAARLNANLAGRLLSGKLVQLDDQQRQALVAALEEGARARPGDGERQLLLAVADLARDRPEGARRRLEAAFAWAEAEQRHLLVAAETFRRLGDRKRLLDFVERLARDPTWSLLFLPGRAEWFLPWAGRVLAPVVGQELLPRLAPGQRQFFAWSWQRYLDAESARPLRNSLATVVEKETGTKLPPEPPGDCRHPARQRPAKYRVYSSWFRAALERYRPLLASCDCTRRKLRSRRQGRLRLELQVASGGRVEQVVVAGNDTGDELLATCMVATLLRLCFPVPLRARELLTVEVGLGLEDNNEQQCPAASAGQ